MTPRHDFAYVQARLQARHGRRPGPPTWQALESSRTAGHYLTLARSGPLADWAERLDERGDPHRIERSLRACWRRHVDEVARWQPQRWQAATRWFATLIELPLIETLRHGGPPARWLHEDERLAAFAQPDPAQRRVALRAAGLAPFAAAHAGQDERSTAVIWLDEWRRMAPHDGHDPALLRRPAELLLPHLGGAGRARDAAAQATCDQLSKLFRRHAGSAVAVFAYLSLVALDLERLRGGVLVRCLFPPGGEPAATPSGPA